MESATILTLLAPALAVFCFPSEPNIPAGPEYEKNINTLSLHGEKYYAVFEVDKLFGHVLLDTDRVLRKT